MEGTCGNWVSGSASVSKGIKAEDIKVGAVINCSEVVFPSSKIPVGAGSSDGRSVGTEVGTAVGAGVGISVGTAVGTTVGSGVGMAVGTTVGSGVGTAVGSGVGAAIGTGVGTGVGTTVGMGIGTAVGASVMTTSEGCVDTGTPWSGGDPSAAAASG